MLTAFLFAVAGAVLATCGITYVWIGSSTPSPLLWAFFQRAVRTN